MEKRTIELVQSSFEKVAPIAETAAKIFYDKLFELDPELEKLFPASNPEAMKGQGNKLMTMLASAVSGLTQLDKLIPILENLGKTHVGYNVEVSHYDTVGAALLETLSIGLGEDFTPEVKEAWTETYNVMASVMKTAAYGEVA
ncbi:hemin receptor [Aquimarina sp. AD10]|uniref:Hemin receptor n=1 Tax=Aquimarina aggregata TaxID=1642818 RepID=A0A163BSU6_9FLAO|nr:MULTISPECIES: globin family protein [Aquimarina]AXT58842.1 hemin receptor [Aquimarina sp. AD10]KZS41712.1 hemin receptor [Aquimarina aggregata]RKM99683.1 hemin receptor [Aquimarina sp. AD10]